MAERERSKTLSNPHNGHYSSPRGNPLLFLYQQTHQQLRLQVHPQTLKNILGILWTVCHNINIDNGLLSL